MTDYNAMTDEELNKLLHELRGLCVHNWTHEGHELRYPRTLICKKCKLIVSGWHGFGVREFRPRQFFCIDDDKHKVPSYTTSDDAMRPVIDELAKKGLYEAYKKNMINGYITYYPCSKFNRCELEGKCSKLTNDHLQLMFELAPLREKTIAAIQTLKEAKGAN